MRFRQTFVFALLTFWGMGVGVYAQKFTQNVNGVDFTFVVNSDNESEVFIGDGENSALSGSVSGTVRIPSQVQYGGKNYHVAAISQYAISGNMKRIEFDATSYVKVIYGGIWACHSLESIEFPENVELKAEAVSHCTNLETITVSSTSNLNINPATHCENLTDFLVRDDGGPTIMESRDGVLFNLDNHAIVACPPAYSGTYTIPDDVAIISQYCFFGCPLRIINIPDGVYDIESFAFAECKNLTSITLPAALFNLGWKTFTSTPIAEVWFRSPDISTDKYHSSYGFLVSNEAFRGATGSSPVMNYPKGFEGGYTKDFNGYFTSKTTYTLKYDFYVMGEEITSENYSSVLPEGMEWDPAWSDLYFNEMDLTLSYDQAANPLVMVKPNKTLNIWLEGNNTITCNHDRQRSKTFWLGNAQGSGNSAKLMIYSDSDADKRGSLTMKGKVGFYGGGGTSITFDNADFNLETSIKPFSGGNNTAINFYAHNSNLKLNSTGGERTMGYLKSFTLEDCEIVTPSGAWFDSESGNICYQGGTTPVTGELVIQREGGATSIEAIEATDESRQAVAPLRYYTPDGRAAQQPRRGMNILRMSDGTTRKVVKE